MFKKKWLILLALTLAAGMVFVGCGDSGGGGGDDPFDIDAIPGGITLAIGGSTQGSSGFNDTTKVATIQGSNSVMFYFTFANASYTFAANDVVEITYACIVDAGEAKVIAKAGADSWTDFSPAQYKDFVQGESNTIEITLGTTSINGLSFQHNVDGNAGAKYRIKILSVAKKS